MRYFIRIGSRRAERYQRMIWGLALVVRFQNRDAGFVSTYSRSHRTRQDCITDRFVRNHGSHLPPSLLSTNISPTTPTCSSSSYRNLQRRYPLEPCTKFLHVHTRTHLVLLRPRRASSNSCLPTRANVVFLLHHSPR